MDSHLLKIHLFVNETLWCAMEAPWVTLSCHLGPTTLFPGHAPYLMALIPGSLCIPQAEGEDKILEHGPGVAFVKPDEVLVHVEKKK